MWAWLPIVTLHRFTFGYLTVLVSDLRRKFYFKLISKEQENPVFHYMFPLKNVKTNTVCTVRVSPRLSPSGPLKMRHSSICPKAENMTRMSFSLHFFDTMPMNSFLSSTAERKEGWKKQM